MSTALSHTPSPVLTCGVLAGDVVRLEPLAPEHVPGLQQAAEAAATSPPAVRGTAVNPAAKLLLLTQALEEWGVDRVDIKTDARNEVARGAIEALGAAFEGVLRAWQPSLAPGEEGRTRDTAMFAITPTQWPGVRTRLAERIRKRSTSSKG